MHGMEIVNLYNELVSLSTILILAQKMANKMEIYVFYTNTRDKCINFT